MAYYKYSAPLRLIYLKFNEILHEMKAYQRENPDGDVDGYLLALCCLDDLVIQLNGERQYIDNHNHGFRSINLKSRYGPLLDDINPLCFMPVKGETA